MSADVAAVIAADKATTGGVAHFGDRWHLRTPGSGSDEWMVDYAPEREDAGLVAIVPDYGYSIGVFISESFSRWPVYIASIEAVQALCERAEKDVTVDRPIQYVWSKDLRRALAVLAPSTDKEQQ